MIKMIFLIGILSITFQSNAQNQIESTGNVGIGTISPSGKLEVLKNADLSNDITISNSGLIIRADNDGNDASLRFGVDNTNLNAVIQTQQTTTATKFDLLLNPFGGNIGIGTTNPSGKLEILKNANLSNAITLPNSGLIIRADNDGNDASLRFGVDNTNLNAVIQTQQTTTATKFNLLLNPFGGNIGIGTTNPDMKLTVRGSIHAEEVKIDLTIPAPDYVFKEDYKLRTLEEIEKFIKENNHLPDIPSAKEFKQNGIMQAEMDMNLLKKIEELTLYTIQQQKEIERLKLIEKRLEKIEKLLELKK